MLYFMTYFVLSSAAKQKIFGPNWDWDGDHVILICHSIGLLGIVWTSSDLLSPSGDAVIMSVIDVAEELLGICTVITAFQHEEKGTTTHDPSCGVEPTSSGWLEHNWLGETIAITNWTGTLLSGVISVGDSKSSTCSATAYLPVWLDASYCNSHWSYDRKANYM